MKNIPYSTKEKDLSDIFERYGSIKRLLISPFNTLTIIVYKTSTQAEAAVRHELVVDELDYHEAGSCSFQIVAIG